jgi:hypothetical protein
MMTGWKTWLSGLALIVTGLFAAIQGIVDLLSGGTGEGLQAAIMTIASGLAVLGIGHKVEKAGIILKKKK